VAPGRRSGEGENRSGGATVGANNNLKVMVGTEAISVAKLPLTAFGADRPTTPHACCFDNCYSRKQKRGCLIIAARSNLTPPLQLGLEYGAVALTHHAPERPRPIDVGVLIAPRNTDRGTAGISSVTTTAYPENGSRSLSCPDPEESVRRPNERHHLIERCRQIRPAQNKQQSTSEETIYDWCRPNLTVSHTCEI
jgi:hypothetical protein